MKFEMYLLPFAIFLFSYIMYIFFHKGKKRPILGEKRNKMTEYLNDYYSYKLYWWYLIMLIFGLTILVIVIVIDLFA